MLVRHVLVCLTLAATGCALWMALQGSWSSSFAIFVAGPCAILAGVTAALVAGAPPRQERLPRAR